MLNVDNIAVTLGDCRLRELSLDVDVGEYYMLLGASGAGKTVLLKTLAGIHPSETGSIVVDGEAVTHERIQRRPLALVHQEQSLFPHMSVERNIGYGLRARGEKRSGIESAVRKLAQEVGVEEFLHRKPSTLSRGESQRVALARALATRPKCLLLDEPLSALDPKARQTMRALLRKIHRNGQTILHVTHDYEEAISLATRVAILENGRIAQAGPPTEIFHHPTSEFIARFVGIKNFMHGELSRDTSSAGKPDVFSTETLQFSVLTDTEAGPGYLILRSEDITLSAARPEGSALNVFRGTVTDVAPAPLGIEVMVDIGVEFAALVTQASVERLALQPGASVWLSFKATAGRCIKE